jgi:hypothetical protein
MAAGITKKHEAAYLKPGGWDVIGHLVELAHHEKMATSVPN